MWKVLFRDNCSGHCASSRQVHLVYGGMWLRQLNNLCLCSLHTWWNHGYRKASLSFYWLYLSRQYSPRSTLGKHVVFLKRAKQWLTYTHHARLTYKNQVHFLTEEKQGASLSMRRLHSPHAHEMSHAKGSRRTVDRHITYQHVWQEQRRGISEWGMCERNKSGSRREEKVISNAVTWKRTWTERGAETQARDVWGWLGVLGQPNPRSGCRGYMW